MVATPAARPRVRVVVPVAVLAAVALGAGAVGLIAGPRPEASADPSADPAPAPRLGALYDNDGISADAAPGAADLDGEGRSLSAGALAAAGWTPGAPITLHGTELRMPQRNPGQADNAVADGQFVRLSADSAGAVTFLAAATGGEASGAGRVLYRDGSTERYTATTPDWRSGTPATKALALPYANTPDGPDGEPARLYAVTVPADPDRAIDGIELPRVNGDARMHVFDVAARAAEEDWSGTWAASASGYAPVGPWEDRTIRLGVRTGPGGPAARLRLDNVFAAEPVEIGAVTVALRAAGAAAADTPVPVTFGGERSVVIPAGGEVTADAVAIDLPAAARLLVSIHLPERVEAAPVHTAATGPGYLGAPGTDLTGATGAAGFTETFQTWPFLAGIDVPGGPGSVVALGDSITDGVGSTEGADRRWPDVLTDRILAQGAVPHYGVLNQGIASNKVVTDRYGGGGVSTDAGGVSTLHRLERDVLAQTNVRTVVVFQGINDLRWGTGADELTAGLTEIADRARAHGIRVIASTIAPCGGYIDCTAEVDARRTAVNDFLRANDRRREADGMFDAVLDFDEVLRDPEQPARILPAYDSGDHLHPGDAGLRAVAESVPLSVLTPVV